MTEELNPICECGHRMSEHETLRTETLLLSNHGKCKGFNDYNSPSSSAHIMCGCERFKLKESEDEKNINQ